MSQHLLLTAVILIPVWVHIVEWITWTQRCKHRIERPRPWMSGCGRPPWIYVLEEDAAPRTAGLTLLARPTHERLGYPYFVFYHYIWSSMFVEIMNTTTVHVLTVTHVQVGLACRFLRLGIGPTSWICQIDTRLLLCIIICVLLAFWFYG